jgi:hypothetical protein
MSSKEFYQSLPYAAVGAVEGVWKYYKPELAWGTLMAGIVAYDLLCEEGGTLSESYKKLPLAMRVGGVALVGAHLIGIPEKIDPITQVFKRVKHG